MFELDGEATVHALAKAASSAASVAEQARAGGRRDWWKAREAALLAVGSACERLSALAAGGCDLGPLQAAAVAQGLLGDELRSGGDAPPFLRGRALWVCSKLVPSLPDEFVVRVCGKETTEYSPFPEEYVAYPSCVVTIATYPI